MRWSEPGPPPPGGWGKLTTAALVAFLALMTVVCVIAERRGQLRP